MPRKLLKGKKKRTQKKNVEKLGQVEERLKNENDPVNAMMISPEGFLKGEGTLIEFKSGAFMSAMKAEAIIIPIVIDGAYELAPGPELQNAHKGTVKFEFLDPIDYKKEDGCKDFNDQNLDTGEDTMKDAMKACGDALLKKTFKAYLEYQETNAENNEVERIEDMIAKRLLKPVANPTSNRRFKRLFNRK